MICIFMMLRYYVLIVVYGLIRHTKYDESHNLLSLVNYQINIWDGWDHLSCTNPLTAAKLVHRTFFAPLSVFLWV